MRRQDDEPTTQQADDTTLPQTDDTTLPQSDDTTLPQSQDTTGTGTDSSSDATNGTGSPVTTTPAPPKHPPQTFYVPIFVLTAVFGAMFIIGPLLVRKGPNSGITRCCIMISAFCMWIFWTTMYISQMNPLMGPRLHNASLAWLGHKWGKNPKSLAALEETP